MKYNCLVTVFLRKLEYFAGILFLTSNRESDFDEAILSRIHLKLRYGNLGADARNKVWEHYLAKAYADGGVDSVSKGELDSLVSKSFNGGQIKNFMALAHALAMIESVPVSYLHIRQALKVNGETASRRRLMN